ncbi:jg10666 [Pararge aegeria aegeria]|uniref:Vesicle-fusing ATPase n=1 Tax=Pararge aegeria aegeria TaxID=348720 RepID=A0A8S4RVP7_9NEOP|nr:jg10666 [Pararge aegeria aegeria]
MVVKNGPHKKTQTEALEHFLSRGITNWGNPVASLLEDGQLYIQQARATEASGLVSVLLEGPPNSGKTALAAQLAKLSDFPFVKVCSPEDMIGFTETAKCLQIRKTSARRHGSAVSVYRRPSCPESFSTGTRDGRFRRERRFLQAGLGEDTERPSGRQDFHWYQKAAGFNRHGETDGRGFESIQIPYEDARGGRPRPRHHYTIRVIATLGITYAYHTHALTRHKCTYLYIKTPNQSSHRELTLRFRLEKLRDRLRRCERMY